MERMPNWLRVWLIGFFVYLSGHWLGHTLLSGGTRPDPFNRLPVLAVGALVFGGVLSWLQTAGDRQKPPHE